MPDKQGRIVKTVLRYVRSYRISLICSILMATIFVVMSLYVPILVGNAIDEIVGAGKVNMAAIVPVLLQIGVCAGIAGISQWCMNVLNNRITYRITKEIRDSAFKHLQVLPLSYLDAHPSGDIVSRVISDVDSFADGLLMSFTQLFTGLLTIIGTLIIMLTIHWKIALIVILVTPLSLFAANFIAKHTFSMFRQQTQIRGEQTAIIDETIGQIKVVKAFGHENASLQEFDKVNERLEKASLRAIFYSSITNPVTRFINAIVYALVGLFGALFVISGSVTVGTLTIFLSYANQYTKPFNEISSVFAEMQSALACAGRVFALIDEPERSEDPMQPQSPEKMEGRLEIRNLKFSYIPSKPLIEDLNLHVEPGEMVAIVGPTGCGKTTFINLLMRFYDPAAGEIVLDGINTSQMKRSELRRNVGMVLQDTWLMSGTIHENIAMGKPDVSREAVVEAAKQAHAHSFIKRLPKGYDTIIGESGGTLSQGQKQLLCIARVMLCLPPMLFLDEATSSIDTRTEIRIQKAFKGMMQGRTSFVVAHRLSTIQEADMILVMRDGKIVEQGKHAQLLEKNGFYAQLYNSQFAH